MFADEADDAAEETAGVSIGGLDEQGDFGGGFQVGGQRDRVPGEDNI